jgi:phosphatidylglycerophosphatase C
MQKGIAFFDFDGTITTKDTLLEFIKFSKGKGGFYGGFLLNSPWLIAYRVKIISNQAAKERMLTWFFRNMPLPVFEDLCARFGREILPSLIRPKAKEEILHLQAEDFSVVVVSASPENWLRGWTKDLGAALLATRLETTTKGQETSLTGKILGLNCHGEEKVRRIQEKYTLSDFENIYTYGDTKGDLPMLRLGNRSFYRPFR